MDTDLVEDDRGPGDDAVFDGTSKRMVVLAEARSTRAAVSSCLPPSSLAIFPFWGAKVNRCSYLEMHLSQLM